MEETKKSRQVQRAEQRALIKKVTTKKDRRSLARVRNRKLRKQIEAEILRQAGA